MMKSVSSRKIALFAAACYAGFTLFTILTAIRTYARNGVAIPLAAVVFWVLLTGMTATILLGAPKQLL